MTFIEAVNRMLRLSTLMQWDDDDITSFSNTQHAGNISLCRQSVQHVLNELVGDNFLWEENANGYLYAVAGTRLYDLEADFVQFQTAKPVIHKLESTVGSDLTGEFMTLYPGGENQLKKDVPQYKSQPGGPQWYYFVEDRAIGLYPVPDATENWKFSYEKNVMVENESDTLPFDSDQKAYAFVDMATRLFSFLFTRQPLEGLGNDIIYKGAKSALMSLLKKQDPIKKYGYNYR